MMKTNRLSKRCLIYATLLVTCVVTTAGAGVDYRLDDELFRRGLIDRGYDELLKVYDREHPPENDLDLLAAEISKAWLTYRRAKTPQLANAALTALLALELERIETYGDHPLAANWRVRYARDILNEKQGSAVFISLLGLTLPDERAAEFKKGLQRVEEQLTQAEAFLAKRLGEFRNMADKDLDAANCAGLPELYQSGLQQARRLRAWCLFYKLSVLPKVERVKTLYALRDLLDDLAPSDPDDGAVGPAVLRAAVLRRLGAHVQAEQLLPTVPDDAPPSIALVADIERVELALALNRAPQALVLADRIDRGAWTDSASGDLVALVREMLVVRAKLAGTPKEQQFQRSVRDQIWRSLGEFLADKMVLGPLIFDQVEALGGGSLDQLSDIELYAHAYQVRGAGKSPLAQRMLKMLIARPAAMPGLVRHGRRLLSDCLADERKFDEASQVLLAGVARDDDQDGSSSEVLPRAATLAWQAYQQRRDEAHRRKFISAAGMLLDRCGDSEQADNFKLLIADQLSQTGQFNQARQWLEQITPGSNVFLQSKAAKVIIFARRFAEVAGRSDTKSTRDLAEQIFKSTKELMVIASARQKTPDDPASWVFSDVDFRLIGNALVTCSRVLSHKAVGRSAEGDKLLTDYKSIVERFRRQVPPALAAQITTLREQFDRPSLNGALGLAQKLLDQAGLDDTQKAQTVIALLATVHRYRLEHYAAPTNPPNDELIDKARQLADRAGKSLSSAVKGPISNHLSERAAIALADAGQYDSLNALLSKQKSPPTDKADVTLASARSALVGGDALTAAKRAYELLQTLSVQDIRYWHALIINLTAHLKLRSEPNQIIAAVEARKEEFSQLGSDATQKELHKILQTARERSKRTSSPER